MQSSSIYRQQAESWREARDEAGADDWAVMTNAAVWMTQENQLDDTLGTPTDRPTSSSVDNSQHNVFEQTHRLKQ